MSHSLSLLLLLSAVATASATTIGVTYVPTPTLPPPEQVATALRSLKITAVRLPVAEPSVIRAFFYTNISLFLSIPNSQLHSISANRSAASLWLYTHVVPFYPRALITAISVGSNVLADGDPTSGDVLLRAVRNVHQSLMDLGIRKITVSTTFSFVNIMMTSFPPSSAEFEEPTNNAVLKPLLQFLTETNSSFFVNLYPYVVYKLRPEIPIGFALFQQQAYNFRDDAITGVRYRNLFDLMVDGVIAALTISGHENIPIVVTETGWPSSDLSNEAENHQIYAEMYLRGLVYHLRSGRGTPLRKDGVAEAYIYEVFDTNTSLENQAAMRVGTGQNWGFLHPNLSLKFEINFSGGFPTTTAALAKVVLGFLLLVTGLLVF
ncbi:glucan endo-1,3-beta-glucosidase 2-like [Cynara cardunculus var. scolymus]|uniref:Glycoside hydrolase, catalytic domain-containing protein n=1 Tax=Cynara cardunculus var. scolymus TaxID=59895 RepID=A0A103YD93_CYNCS|nr:glucan endo-1,3-beta-glucosidase 2-like [Cynara cardunculus var. scolymus]KVI06972.1 Glycoside hydrolase, catalytic domain-containing protein [Cynara cardunculus var. scolymus]